MTDQLGTGRRTATCVLDGEEFPVLPVRAQALFPHSMVPLTVRRSIPTLDSLDGSGRIVVLGQRNAQADEPSLEDLHTIGTLGALLRLGTDEADTENAVALVHGVKRVRVVSLVQSSPCLRVRVEALEDVAPGVHDGPELTALARNVKRTFAQIAESVGIPNEVASFIQQIDDPALLSDLVAASSPFLPVEIRQALLETTSVVERMRRLTEALLTEREAQKLQKRIHDEVIHRFGEEQREVFLREQLRAIRKQLGEDADGFDDTSELRARLDQAGLPEEARAEADRELARLERMLPSSPEHTMARTYLEWLASLPWGRATATEVDLELAQRVLDEDHYDLKLVKERILEHLAVVALKRDMKSPILCFVGPPGVGKTSLGRSIARATGRAFARMSLGGVGDEAEIRGHRRTYVGALPGQILRCLRRAGTHDPVLLLDEIDKLGRGARGDPSAALLEVLDSEQNAAFRDHYLDVPFDLSRVFFLATANVRDPIPPALRDRMEMLELPGYVEEDKHHIAHRFLIPRQAAENGIGAELGQPVFTDDAVRALIHGYTHEAGVRELERRVAAIFRKWARQIVSKSAPTMTVTAETVRELLGAPTYRIESELEQRVRSAGVAVAVAWTDYGGDVLFVESARTPRGRGKFTVTGQVKDVMQESARAALTWVRAHVDDFAIDPSLFDDSDIHVHIPVGAMPKDGPSAGVAIVTALTSLLAARPVRPFVAMTGEITLSGRILPVGGLKEKVLAAKRSGVREMLVPDSNRDQLHEQVPAALLGEMKLHFVETVHEVLACSLSPRVPAAQSRGWPRSAQRGR